MKPSPEFERFEGLLADGYSRWDDNDPVGACGHWLEAWPLFLRLAEETGVPERRLEILRP